MGDAQRAGAAGDELVNLTRRQHEYLKAIQGFIRRKGYAPSHIEIAVMMKVRSTATVHKQLARLAKRGAIILHHNRARSIEIVMHSAPAGEAKRLLLEAALELCYVQESVDHSLCASGNGASLAQEIIRFVGEEEWQQFLSGQ